MRAKFVIPVLASILIFGAIGYGVVFADDDNHLSSLLCPVGQAMTGILLEDDDEILDVICDTGAAGPQGDPGPEGPEGPAGADGADGTDGTDGADGADGLSCWDLNGDTFCDTVEDVNFDTFCDVLDCRGSDGTDGADGTGLSCENQLAIADVVPDFTLDEVCAVCEPITEVCSNSRDDDCDGVIDEAIHRSCQDNPFGSDFCDLTFTSCSTDEDCAVIAGPDSCGTCPAVSEICSNGIDDDCDGKTDEAVLGTCGGFPGIPGGVCDTGIVGPGPSCTVRSPTI